MPQRQQKIGGRSFQYISSYKRGTQVRNISGQYQKKQTVKSHTRFNRWWGSAGPLKSKPVISFFRNPITIIAFRQKAYPQVLITDTNLSRALMKDGRSPQVAFRDWYQTAGYIVNNGVLKGIDYWENNYLEYIPSRSESLRRDVVKSVRQTARVLKRNNTTFNKVVIRMGAPNIKYANITNKYTQKHVQLQHHAGTQMSGVGNQFAISRQSSNPYKYNAGTGDPKAQYQWYGKSRLILRETIKKYTKKELVVNNIPPIIFNWLIKMQENKLENGED